MSTALEPAGSLQPTSVIPQEVIEARGSGTKEAVDTYDKSNVYKSELRVFWTGIMFLTRLPCPSWVDHHPAYLMRSMQYFPLFGALVGAWGAAFIYCLAGLWPPSVVAGMSTLATVWLTGCFHEDGLADCFDGFGGGWGRVQILRIMKDSRVGTYGLVGMVLVLHQKLHALAAMDQDLVVGAMIAAHSVSRWTSVPLLYCLEYIQDEEDAKRGLYNWFAQSRVLLSPARLLISTVTAGLVPMLVLRAKQALLVYAVTITVALASGMYAKAIINGVVGDYLGATTQVTELAVYLALLADGSILVTPEGWQRLFLLGGVMILPVLYSRKIIDFGEPR